MKTTFTLILLTLVFLMTSATTCLAENKAPLGVGNLMLKVDYIDFTDSYFTESDGLYVGLEGYYSLTNSMYLGGEVGQAANITLFGGEEIDFVPVELNAKYVSDLGTNLYLDFGVGVSYNRTELTYDSMFGNDIDRGNEWLFGGQVFTDITYKLGRFAIGLNGKYQTTEEFKDSGVYLSNFRLGLSLGACF